MKDSKILALKKLLGSLIQTLDSQNYLREEFLLKQWKQHFVTLQPVRAVLAQDVRSCPLRQKNNPTNVRPQGPPKHLSNK